jgi:formate dehydrogenase iron-sulfur subunit
MPPCGDSGRDPAALSGHNHHPARKGFFTDTSICIGCKACEVACKTWNGVPEDGISLLGSSYDNTGTLGADTWRHVAFIEQKADDGFRWLMSSDVCKHCTSAACLDVCPTGALARTEFGTVIVQSDICNGCGYCVPACPFGVVDISSLDGKAHKCTLCYDRLKGGLEPACAKACPTDSIQFGEVADLQQRARERVEHLHRLGVDDAYLYGTPDAPGATGGLQHLNAFFLLTESPETYNLPTAPTRPAERVAPSLLSGVAAMAGLAVAAITFLSRRA